jgi:hypothetical protein
LKIAYETAAASARTIPFWFATSRPFKPPTARKIPTVEKYEREKFEPGHFLMLNDDRIERHHDRGRILDDDSRRHVRFLDRKVIEIIRPRNPANSYKEEMRYVSYPERKDARIRDEEENRRTANAIETRV